MGVVDELKLQMAVGKIAFDSDQQRVELLGENSGTKVTTKLQNLVLALSKLSMLKISSVIRNSGHHAQGRAVDFGNEGIASTLLPLVATDTEVGRLEIDEIIFDAAKAGQSDRNKWNYDLGKKHNYDAKTLDDHQDHIHFAVIA
jgi:hypothetical protein